MIKTITTFCYLFILVTVMCSCLGESKNLQKVNKGETIEKTARYHFLEDNGTKIYLPSDFERVSLTEYQKLLKSSSTKTPRPRSKG